MLAVTLPKARSRAFPADGGLTGRSFEGRLIRPPDTRILPGTPFQRGCVQQRPYTRIAVVLDT